MLRHTLAAAAVAALAAGCSFQPAFQRPVSPVADTFPAGPAYERSDAAPDASGGRSAQGLPAADIGWRDFFADARLQRVIELALQNNRDLRTSILNVEAVRAQYLIARADLFPALDIDASATRQRTPPSLAAAGRTQVRQYSVGLGASWELDFFGRIRSLKDEALAQYLSTAEARKSAELALVAAVADQYLAVLAYDDLLAITRNTLKTAQESFDITKLQFDTGTGSELDLRQAQSVVQQAQANLQSQLRLRAQAENALTLLVGQPLPADLPAGVALGDQNLLADIPAGLPSDLIARRPDIAAAEQALRAANADIGAARAAFFPRISLTGSFGTLSPTLGGLFDSNSEAWSFVPQLTLPIFTGGAATAGYELAKVRQRIEVANYEKTIQTAFREVADGLAARGTFDEQIRQLAGLTDSQNRRLELSDLRYRNGVDSYLAVLTAQTDLYAAQQSLISARLQRLTNLVDLYQALGGGWLERTGDQPRPADTTASGDVEAQK
ncbi:efflux RND transporter outer membrane subunit OprB [Pigmentiphaga soli]|uniref:Efflux RND transporter outer membrane subunit OprB n=1 Tax=Pigmentiphaga soli TaxID=1007095 RepID=A0ABP8GZ75_9BURK